VFSLYIPPQNIVFFEILPQAVVKITKKNQYSRKTAILCGFTNFLKIFKQLSHLNNILLLLDLCAIIVKLTKRRNVL